LRLLIYVKFPETRESPGNVPIVISTKRRTANKVISTTKHRDDVGMGNDRQPAGIAVLIHVISPLSGFVAMHLGTQPP
jgi:hypothetical protein